MHNINKNITLNFEIDTQCNIGCSYCFYAKQKNGQKLKYLKYIKECLLKINPSKILLWGGDILNNKNNIINVISEIKTASNNIVYFTTQCNTLKRDFNTLIEIKEILKDSFNLIISSDLSGIKKCDNIELIKKLKNEISLSIYCVITEKDLKDDFKNKMLEHLNKFKDFNVNYALNLYDTELIVGLEEILKEDFQEIYNFIIKNNIKTNLFTNKPVCSNDLNKFIQIDVDGYFKYCTKTMKEYDIKEKFHISEFDKYDEFFKKIEEFRDSMYDKMDYCKNKCNAYDICYTCPKHLSELYKNGYKYNLKCQFYQTLKNIGEINNVKKISLDDISFNGDLTDNKIQAFIYKITQNYGDKAFKKFLSDNKDIFIKYYGNNFQILDINRKTHKLEKLSADEYIKTIRDAKKLMIKYPNYNSTVAIIYNIVRYKYFAGECTCPNITDDVKQEMKSILKAMEEYILSKNTRHKFMLICDMLSKDECYDINVQQKIKKMFIEAWENEKSLQSKTALFDYISHYGAYIFSKKNEYLYILFNNIFEPDFFPNGYILYDENPENLKPSNEIVNEEKEKYDPNKIYNLIKDNKFSYIDKSGENKRYAVCLKCKHNINNICKLCKIDIKLKSKIYEDACPLDKWEV